MAKTLGETGGLGTVATRADIIEKLFSSFLLEKRGKDICLTSKAKQLLTLVPEDLRKPELTADWEMRLSKIADGKLKRAAFMKDIRSYSNELISQIKSGEGQFRHDNVTNTKCPVCGKRMLLVKGKNSEMLVCQDRECGHRETVARTSNARCPVCHKNVYPRINPAVIVAVLDHGRLLMTKYANRPLIRRYALIAGFCEIGESFEDTVRREVMEEVCLRVKNLRFYKSQPWVLTDSLLLGFFCDVDGDPTPVLRDGELALAEWHTPEDVPADYSRISLTGEMIDRFREGRIPK